MTLAIIGTAGRKDDAPKLTKEKYFAAMKVAKSVMESVNADTLVSGGAAFIDHIAVRLFNAGLVKNLTLHIPCKWDKKNKRYKDTGEFNSTTNPGGTANYYHKKFSEKVGFNSLEDIAAAIKKKAQVVVTEGFKERNSKVAEEADVILAMTFGNGAYIKDGGTADTVRKYFNKEGELKGFHFDLNSMTLHDDIILS